jgi:hypothetical protein
MLQASRFKAFEQVVTNLSSTQTSNNDHGPGVWTAGDRALGGAAFAPEVAARSSN